MNNKILVALFLLVLIIGLLYFTHEVYTRPSEEFVDMKKNINKQKPVPKKVNVECLFQTQSISLIAFLRHFKDLH